MNVLFIAWDGPQQSYLESLFFPIQARLRDHGFQFHVMQFSWGDGQQAIARAAEQVGIAYQREVIVRRPKQLATAAAVGLGALAIRRYVARHDIDVVMPRSTIPAAMTLLATRGIDARIVFDADGFMPDERVDFAGWRPTGVSYRIFRDVEAQMLRRANAVITRTARAKEILVARAGAGTDPSKIFVIPNGKDADLFRPFDADTRRDVRRTLGLATDAPLIAYVGSWGPQYYPARMFQIFDAIRRQRSDAHMLVLTGQTEEAHQSAMQAGAEMTALTIKRAAPDAVARYLAASDVGLALRESTFSQRGVSPIKVSEYLLCGVPLITNAGIGDLDAQLGAHGLGHLLEGTSDAETTAAAGWFVEHALAQRELLRTQCRARGVELFGLKACVDAYARALASVRT